MLNPDRIDSDGSIGALGCVMGLPYYEVTTGEPGTSVHEGDFGFKPLDLCTDFSCSVSLTHVTCSGGTDGAIGVLTTNGTPAYSYLWNDTAGQTTDSATGLSAGVYTVTVTDDAGCTTTCKGELFEPNICCPPTPGVFGTKGAN